MKGCLPMAQISRKQLAALARRVGVALESGIEERKIWQREAERARGSSAAVFGRISAALGTGGSIGDAVLQSDGFFPPLFVELVGLGEATGKLASVFRRLADHYEQSVRLRRTFLAGITWPLIQLTAAIVIVGLLIWILGLIAENRGPAPYDILGLGLVGNAGVVIYVTIVGSLLAVATLLFFLIRSRVFWIQPVEVAAIAVPGIGGCIKTLCLSRLSWSLGLSLAAGMDARSAVPFALRMAGNHYFARHQSAVSSSLMAGDEMFVALAGTGAFPDEFLDALQVGEQSGRLDESMLQLAEEYQDRSRAALATLTTLAGFAVWALVALILIAIIANMVSGYANFLEGLAQPH